jgi:hypothetical protein
VRPRDGYRPRAERARCGARIDPAASLYRATDYKVKHERRPYDAFDLSWDSHLRANAWEIPAPTAAQGRTYPAAVGLGSGSSTTSSTRPPGVPTKATTKATAITPAIA